MLTSSDFRGLLNPRFFNNFLPIPPTSTMALGAVAINFELPDITYNRSIKLSDYQNDRPVILAFTRIFTEKQYCPVCFPHIKALNEQYQKFVDAGAEVLLITSTDHTQSQQVVRDLGLRLPLLSDPSCRIFRIYGVGQALGAPLPAQFVLDQHSLIRYRHLFSFFDHNASVETLLRQLPESA
jgi:peroxiredoxin